MTAVAFDERVFDEISTGERDPASRQKRDGKDREDSKEDVEGFTDLDVKWFEEGE